MVRFRTLLLSHLAVPGLVAWKGAEPIWGCGWSLEVGNTVEALTERWWWPGWSHSSASGEERSWIHVEIMTRLTC